MKFLPLGRIQNRNNFIIKIDIFVNGKNQRPKSIVRNFLKVQLQKLEWKKTLLITKDSLIDLNRFIHKNLIIMSLQIVSCPEDNHQATKLRVFLL